MVNCSDEKYQSKIIKQKRQINNETIELTFKLLALKMLLTQIDFKLFYSKRNNVLIIAFSCHEDYTSMSTE